ncbi:hypothetical protein BU25DRAFT_424203 [Macroventuria anomochaeta]|uniref:Uncharacterized protein n=1 Tax=Macroventuria anomochaeta TaxID=301207 RepID=A0ACB6RRL6_9PLEO|nr:uncharacterized protein BU25DRAFT_424203 [Macroventuria anomochaeta]KAF2624438.1 hypothetical protein BU25DRAFT_424203 [Macroventuria anomochaeta]
MASIGIRFFNIRTQAMHGHKGHYSCSLWIPRPVFSPDEKAVLHFNDEGTIVRDGAAVKVMSVLEASGQPKGIAFLPDGRYFAVITTEGMLEMSKAVTKLLDEYDYTIVPRSPTSRLHVFSKARHEKYHCVVFAERNTLFPSKAYNAKPDFESRSLQSSYGGSICQQAHAMWAHRTVQLQWVYQCNDYLHFAAACQPRINHSLWNSHRRPTNPMNTLEPRA